MKNYEKLWLEQINKVIEANYKRPDFYLQNITQELEISHAKLYRNLLKLTGLSPGKYIKKLRLEKAKKLLEVGEYSTVKETSREVGFHRPDYFTKLFYNEFNILPSKILKE